jgi:LysM repeat protein
MKCHAHILLAILATFCAFTASAQTSHVVRVGETLDGIARRYGVRVSAIVAVNNLERPDILRVGQTLKIPAREAPSHKRYIVEEGDTLGSIARDHGVSPDAIMRLNNLNDPNRLRAGQIIEIPLEGKPLPPVVRHRLPSALKSELDHIPVRPGRWRYIVIHHSATDRGNAKILDHYHRHRRKMANGLAYHFVIGNGRGMRDGEIAIGHRWRAQLKGGHLASDALNDVSIGVCLVGNYEKERPTPAQMRSLYALTGYLLQRTRAPSTAVRTHRQINTKPTACPGRNFPTRALLENLP